MTVIHQECGQEMFVNVRTKNTKINGNIPFASLYCPYCDERYVWYSGDRNG